MGPDKGREATTSMFIDSGCDYTIIPPEFYHETMGRIEDSDINLRAWGAEELLKVKGMVNTTLETTKGAKKTTKVYIVDGIHPEPLLGAFDAKDLGFIKINKGGRDPTKEESASIKLLTPSNIRDSLKIDIITHPKIEEVDKVETLEYNWLQLQGKAMDVQILLLTVQEHFQKELWACFGNTHASLSFSFM